MTDTTDPRDVSPGATDAESRPSTATTATWTSGNTQPTATAAAAYAQAQAAGGGVTVALPSTTLTAPTSVDLSSRATQPVTPYDSDGTFDPDTAVENMAAVFEYPAETPLRDDAGRLIYGIDDLDDCDHAEGVDGSTYVHKADPRRAHESNYCSGRCEYRALAESVIDTMTYDHRFCASCFRRQKTITPPRQETEWGGTSNGRYLADQDVTKEAFVGLAYATKYARLAVVATDAGEETNTAPAEFPPNNQTYRQRRNCECGVTHHAMRDWPLSKADAIDAARHLAESLDSLREELLAGSGPEAERARRWDFSEDLLLYSTGKLKSMPRRQFNERRLFVTALATALRYPGETV